MMNTVVFHIFAFSNLHPLFSGFSTNALTQAKTTDEYYRLHFNERFNIYHEIYSYAFL